MKRYFIIVYEGSGEIYSSGRKTDSVVKSSVSVNSSDGVFPKRSTIISEIKDRNEGFVFDADPLISNIIELSEKDWNDYQT